MATEQLQGLPYPAGTDAPDGPAQILALAQAVAKKAVQVYASAAARTAAFSAAFVSPAEGMLTYRTDADVWEEWDGSAWVPQTEGDTWTALTLPAGYSTVAGWHAPAYRKAGRKRVIFRGACNVSASNAAGTKFTMPAGFRPVTNSVMLAAPYSNGTDISGHLRFNVSTAGAMATTLATPAATIFLGFEGLSYAID